MPRTSRFTVGLLLGGLLAGGGDRARAHDQEFPIEGRRLVVRSGGSPARQRFAFSALGQPAIGPRHDPAEGVSVHVGGTGANAGHTGLITLDPTLWKPLGKSSHLRGYRYRDRNGTRGGITKFTLKQGKFLVEGKGEHWPWVPGGPQDDVWVHVTIEDETFCARFGGSVTRNESGYFRSRRSAAPDECPEQLCGNGERELGEECDDGNLNEKDGCTSTCVTAPCELADDIDSTFEAIQSVIFDSEVYGCTTPVCHGGGAAQGNLRLGAGLSYDQLVGVASFGSLLDRVEPGEPALSFLYNKLAAATLGTPTGGGSPMPLGGGTPLTPEHLEAVEKWIRGGAPRDLVVEGTAELLGSCLPEPDPLVIPEPDPPPPGRGFQLQQTPWPLPAGFEDEICMVTYYDLTATDLVPDTATVPCPPEFQSANNPSGECFRYHKQVLFQDPQSHHSIIHAYTGEFDHTAPGWGPFTFKFQDPANPLEGMPCDPTAVDPNTGYNPGCSGSVQSTIACVGYGPPDYSQGGVAGFGGTGTAPSFSGSQEPYYELEFAPGAYSILPKTGFVVWNSHAFNLTAGDSTMSQYLNLEFAGLGDQLFPVQLIFDARSIFGMVVPPFGTQELCRTFTVPRDGRLFQLSSHTHRHGSLFRIWAPPNVPCSPGDAACVPRTDAPIYFSTEYADPQQLLFDPPVDVGTGNRRSRSYLYCSVYDNGASVNAFGEPRHPVKRQSTSPAPPLVFGLPLGPGGPCPDAPANPALGVTCMDGPRKGQPCFGDDSLCDDVPGDGVCDACPVLGGVTTEDEMFILLGSYYIDDGSTAGTEITPANVGALGVKWNFPLNRGVTSSPTVTNDFVYVSSWNGQVYALDKDTGAVVWSFDTGAGIVTGVQSTVAVAPGGQVVFGDSLARVYSLDGETGSVNWQKTLGNPARDHVWSAATIANDRVFIGVASHSDQPCTNGRLIALDLLTGDELWTRQNVPAKICSTDTAIECSDDSECGGGSCVEALGAGVTATVAVSPDGESVYMNTVGCFTFPSVGDSDSIMKLDAATGATQWIRRVTSLEQFGACADDPSIDCGSDAACGGATCAPKAFYHDFGFLNGPLRVDVDDGAGGIKALVVSGSKDGTLYALDESDGTIAWTNAVVPVPVTPAFAGFGLFNGALAYADGRFHAALYQHSPATNPAPDHLMTFEATDGSVIWSDDIGASWGHVAASNGVVFTGTNVAAEFYAYNAASGARLATFPLPAITSSKAAVDGRSLYIGYGILGTTGGVRAYILP